MHCYDFYLHNDGESDHLGGLILPHDQAAVAFGKQVLRDLTGNQYAHGLMHIIEHDRIVDAILVTAQKAR